MTTDGNTALYTNPYLHDVGFLDITDTSNPLPLGYTITPGIPVVVAVKDAKYAAVAVEYSHNSTTVGEMIVLDLSTREIVREIELDGQPDCKF